MDYHKIVHREIKPSNIVWGIFGYSNILNKNDIYFIDYGYSEFMDLTFSREDKKTYDIKGTREFLSINSHYHGIPNTNDNLERIIYSLLYLNEIGLPWLFLNFSDISKYKEALKMKLEFVFYKFCGSKCEFLVDSLEFLRKFNENKENTK